MAYEGPERRIHKVFVTRNTEYYVRAQRCVAVRDRSTGAWVRDHFAVDRAVMGAIRYLDTGELFAGPGLPQVGESMYFEELGHDLVTSAVVAVERPARELIQHLPM
jgi:hypothetical protein